MGRLSSTRGLAAGEDDPDFVRALARGLSVLEAFDVEHAEMTLTEIAGRVGLTRGSVRRLLLTLQHLGYVGTDGSRFHLRTRVMDLGYGFLSSLPVWEAARTYLDELNEETGESSSLAVLDGFDIVYVARHAAKRILKDYIPIGTRYPAHATSMGKVLLAGLPQAALQAALTPDRLVALTPNTVTDMTVLQRQIEEVRQRGWAVNDEEIEIGLRSIAVPVRDRAGRTVAALNISVSAARVHVEQLQQWLPSLHRAAAAIMPLVGNR